VLTSNGFFVARKLVEPFLERKANEAAYVSHAPFTKWLMAANVYRKGEWILITGLPYTKGGF
jgi:hypothetical protein